MLSVGFKGYVRNFSGETFDDEERVKLVGCYRKKFYSERYGCFDILYDDYEKKQLLGSKWVFDEPTVLSQIDDRYSTIDDVVVIPNVEIENEERNKICKVFFIRIIKDYHFKIPLSDFLWMIIFNKLISINNKCKTHVTFAYIIEPFDNFIANMNDIKYLNLLFEKIDIHIIRMDKHYERSWIDKTDPLDYFRSRIKIQPLHSPNYSSFKTKSSFPDSKTKISRSEFSRNSFSRRHYFYFNTNPSFVTSKIQWGDKCYIVGEKGVSVLKQASFENKDKIVIEDCNVKKDDENNN
jgi:hypothetical protein